MLTIIIEIHESNRAVGRLLKRGVVSIVGLKKRATQWEKVIFDPPPLFRGSETVCAPPPLRSVPVWLELQAPVFKPKTPPPPSASLRLFPVSSFRRSVPYFRSWPSQKVFSLLLTSYEIESKRGP